MKIRCAPSRRISPFLHSAIRILRYCGRLLYHGTGAHSTLSWQSRTSLPLICGLGISPESKTTDKPLRRTDESTNSKEENRSVPMKISALARQKQSAKLRDENIMPLNHDTRLERMSDELILLAPNSVHCAERIKIRFVASDSELLDQAMSIHLFSQRGTHNCM